MEKYLRPEKFDADPSASTNNSHYWTHWKTTFENFYDALNSGDSKTSKFQLLIHHISAELYIHIKDCEKYQDAIELLDSLFLKPVNEVYSRYQLSRRQQNAGETVDQYLQSLKLLSKECNFKAVTAEQNRNDFIRDSFIAGLSSSSIRQRLLENSTLTLDDAYKQARALEIAQIQNNSYGNENIPIINSTNLQSRQGQTCYFCGNNRHPRRDCPASDVTCLKCGKKGHFAKVCRSTSKKSLNTTAMATEEDLTSETNPLSHQTLFAQKLSCILSATNLSRATAEIKINNSILAKALIDTGSTGSFINRDLAVRHNLRRNFCNQKITMAKSNMISEVEGSCHVDIDIQGQRIEADLMVLDGLCCDVILGHDMLQQHEMLVMTFGGVKPSLKLCVLSQANIKPVSLFSNLTVDCEPIAIRSRRHNDSDSKFIESEVQKLLTDGIIEPSMSPWRAQVLVTSSEHHKKRMVIDYSQTINKFTKLDAYPLPNIDDIVSKVAKHKVFSKIDLKSAYHQIPILDKEKVYTAFEACGNLYQFRRIPFGVTNGVAAFQRAINAIIEKEKIKGVYAYLDDITICGMDQKDHDEKLKKFNEIANNYNLTINKEKSEFSITDINILGYNIHNGIIKPDADRLRPLLEFPIPSDSASLKRALGLFAHYSRWIKDFSSKIHILVRQETFPLTNEAIQAFKSLKEEIVSSVLYSIENNVPLTVETDASDYAIAATLSQDGRPVAFFSRTLSSHERNHSSIEKEAAAIVESLKKWRSYLIGRPFHLITDQRSVSYMFDQQHSSKIKNDKIQRWRLELSSFNYDIVYRPGKENIVADTLSRANVISASTHHQDLKTIHNDLCHPGITRMIHWVRTKNLPFSIEEIKKMTAACAVCAQIKPKFLKTAGTLIKATAPFERLSMDFKGPLPSCTRNRYILTIIDEFSRFPFAIPCPDLSADTVKMKLTELFAVFGIPSYIHSDRGATFLSDDIKNFFHNMGTATSYTTPYNPQGNGQTERYNGIIWKSIELALKSSDLPTTKWETVLNPVLHSIRSLLCTATGCTPHERMFTHQRRSANGQSMPSWLSSSEKVLLKNHLRRSKYDPIVEEVDLLEANPLHSRVRFQSGREAIVSNRHLAPSPPPTEESDSSTYESLDESLDEESQAEEQALRRSDRERRPPAYLKDYAK